MNKFLFNSILALVVGVGALLFPLHSYAQQVTDEVSNPITVTDDVAINFGSDSDFQLKYSSPAGKLVWTDGTNTLFSLSDDGSTGTVDIGTLSGDVTSTTQSPIDNSTKLATTAYVDAANLQTFLLVIGDETTAITTGTEKYTFRMPYAFTVTEVRASLAVAGTTSSIPTVDIHESGTTILSTKLTIDLTEKTSETAATPAVISDSNLADDAEITIDFDAVDGGGTAAGMKVYIIGRIS